MTVRTSPTLGAVGVVFDRAPAIYVTTQTTSGGVLIAGPNLLPGWKCTACSSYNNIERMQCKFSKCGRPRLITQHEFDEFVDAIREADGRVTVLRRR